MGAGHDHGLGEVQHEKPLWWGFGLTAAFLVAEVVGGLVTNSLALLSDAAHMATASFRWCPSRSRPMPKPKVGSTSGTSSTTKLRMSTSARPASGRSIALRPKNTD